MTYILPECRKCQERNIKLKIAYFLYYVFCLNSALTAPEFRNCYFY